MISVLAIFMVLIYLAASSTEKKQEKLPSQARFFWKPCLFPPQQAEPWLIKSLCVGSDMGVWEDHLSLSLFSEGSGYPAPLQQLHVRKGAKL